MWLTVRFCAALQGGKDISTKPVGFSGRSEGLQVNVGGLPNLSGAADKVPCLLPDPIHGSRAICNAAAGAVVGYLFSSSIFIDHYSHLLHVFGCRPRAWLTRRPALQRTPRAPARGRCRAQPAMPRMRLVT